MKNTKYFLAVAALTASQSSLAAGFAISAQSAYGLGNAYAGSAALSDDATTSATNPAGMVDLERAQFAVSGALTVTDAQYTDQGSLTNVLFGATPVALEDGVGPNENISANAVTPGVYYARPFGEKWAVGFAFQVPFGTSSDYGDDWIGRYQGVETQVTAFDFNPTIAYKINDRVSIGGGISVQFADALLTSQLDSGATCLGIIAGANANGQNIPITTCNDLGLAVNDPLADSSVDLEGSGTRVTFNLGALFKPTDTTTIGLTYRNGTQHELEGDADFENNPALDAFVNSFPEGFRPLQDTGITISADLPAIADLAISQQVNEQIELLGTLRYTQWSSFDALTSEFDNPAQADTVLDFDWEDAFFVSGGANYKLNDRLTLRAGLAFDETPIPNPQSRSVRGPANDRFWVSLGGSYRFTDNLTAHAGYTNVQINESAINNPGGAGNPTVRGSYEISANVFALQVNWNFN